MGFHRGRIAPSVILLAAVGVTTLSTAAARQAKECKGNGEDESFYPTVNNSFPGNNVFQNERFKVDSNVYPGTQTYGCVANPLTPLDTNLGKRSPYFDPLLQPGSDALDRNSLNYTVSSAQYWCNANGTVLSYREYNNTGCGGSDLIHYGNLSVPFTRNGYTFDCSCWGTDVFVETRVFNISAGREVAGGRLDHTGGPTCKGANYESTMSMSGSCYGYYDNLTKVENASMRSVRVTCDFESETVEVVEYTDTLDCDNGNKAVLNETYDLDTCVSVRNLSIVFVCDVIGGGSGKTKKNTGFTLSLNDALFLLGAFLYLCFVLTLCSVMYCYMTSKKKEKEKEGKDEGDEDDKVIDTDAEAKKLAAEGEAQAAAHAAATEAEVAAAAAAEGGGDAEGYPEAEAAAAGGATEAEGADGAEGDPQGAEGASPAGDIVTDGAEALDAEGDDQGAWATDGGKAADEAAAAGVESEESDPQEAEGASDGAEAPVAEGGEEGAWDEAAAGGGEAADGAVATAAEDLGDPGEEEML